MKRDYNNFHILKSIEADTSISQTKLSSQMKLNVTSLNFILKRLVQRGFITMASNFPMNTKYCITPEGLREKKHLAFNFYRENIPYYKKVKNDIEARIVEATNGIETDIAIYGTSEHSEIAYMVVSKMKFRFLGFFLEDPKVTNDKIFGHRVKELKLLKRSPKCLLLLTEKSPAGELNDMITRNVKTLNLIDNIATVLN